MGGGTITQVHPLRAELEPLPDRLARLPVHRGYPVPWFVEWIVNGQSAPIGTGEPDFRVMSHERFSLVLKTPLCWICGGRLGAYRSFVIGPMCAVNRTSGEPPSHRECGEWSARNCPFLSRPHMRRREAGKQEGLVEAAGIMLDRNPGVALVWTTRSYKPFNAPGGVLFEIGEPEDVTWWAEGRPATRAEILASIDSGLPALRGLAETEGRQAVRELERYIDRAMTLLPAA